MILHGVSNSVFIHLCRVILSRMMNPTTTTVVRLLSDLFLVLTCALKCTYVLLCFPKCYAVNTIRSTSSAPRFLVLPSGEGVSTGRTSII